MSAKRLALLLDAAEARLSPGDWQGLWVFVALLEGQRSWFHVTTVTSIDCLVLPPADGPWWPLCEPWTTVESAGLPPLLRGVLSWKPPPGVP